MIVGVVSDGVERRRKARPQAESKRGLYGNYEACRGFPLVKKRLSILINLWADKLIPLVQSYQ